MSQPLGANSWKLWVASVISNLGDGVGMIAYPWLASAVTRNPLHIAAVALVTRLPWLLFSLPAGVVTDRVDRRRLAAWMDVGRFLITLGVALAVLANETNLASPAEIEAGTAVASESAVLLILIYVAALLLGTAEVFRDNSAQTLLPSIVSKDRLETANGRLWGAEMVTNTFIGPPLAGILIAIGFSVPFFLDATTFAVAAALVFMIAGDFAPKGRSTQRRSFRDDLKEGVRWLWSHPLFKPMAISLGILNGAAMMSIATLVLFAQEVLQLDATQFGLLTTGVAVGGVIGAFAGDRIARALGQGPSLFVTIIFGAISLVVSGLTSSFWVFWAMGLVSALTGTLWNVITVSLRQSLIPDRILGRVNSVYRFVGWGMMPIGSALGGVVVAVAEPLVGREWALRAPFLIAGAITALLFIYAAPRLNSSKISEARAEAEPVAT